MKYISTTFQEDIVIDQDAFNKASTDLQALSTRLNNFKSDVEDMLLELQKGFDTPAGRKFIESCRMNLGAPIADQMLVLQHISDTLNQVIVEYNKVFTSYDEMNNAIKAYKN